MEKLIKLSDVEQACQKAIEFLLNEKDEPFAAGAIKGLTDSIKEIPAADAEQDRWISVNDRMPEEHDSIFSQFYGTPKWRPEMFRKTSKPVFVCIKRVDGTRYVDKMYTIDGAWELRDFYLRAEVTHWMPMCIIELPKEG